MLSLPPKLTKFKFYAALLAATILFYSAVAHAVPPGQAVLISPVGSSSTSTPSYKWQEVSGATRYYLWVNDVTGTPIKTWHEASVCNESTGMCSTTPGTAIAGNTTWWIRSWNSSGYGPWSDGLSFSYGDAVPGKPTLIAPSGAQSAATPTYSWNPVPNAAWYQLWVTDEAGTPLTPWYTADSVNCASMSGDCTVTPNVPITGNANWWVRAWNTTGYGSWSDAKSFFTDSIVEPGVEPGATFTSHHETIPNPVYNSEFRVAASCKSVAQACDWNNPGTWQTGAVPDSNSRVIIDGQVQIQNQSAVALSIGIYPGGKLSFSTNANTQLRTADLIVAEGGVLEIGTQNSPIGSVYRAEVIFRDLPFDEIDSEQHLRGLLALDGSVRIFGHAFNNTFLRTAIEPKAGDTAISMTQSATEAGWRVGDSVLVPTSAQCANASDNSCQDQTEDRTIVAISADGLNVTFDQALQFDHPGARSHAGTLDFTPHVINKSRNVILRSENPDGVRGHLLFHGRSDIDMRYADVRALGRTDIRNLGPSNQKGRYPVHAHHLIGPTAPQANGYQFTFVGNTIDFGEQNREQDRKWGLTIHGSHYGLIEQNVVDYASGAGIVTESGSEMGNVFSENFVVRVVGGNGERTHDPDPVEGSKLGRAGTGYWFNGGGRNVYENNVAAAIDECVYCYGFKFDNVYNGELLFPDAQGSDPHMSGGEVINADAIGINDFTGNEAYAVPNGLTVWWACSFGDRPVDNCSSRLDSFQLWHHHRWGYYGYPVNNISLENFVVRGDPTILNNYYESVVGITFGDYMTRNGVIKNADVQNVRTAIQMPSMRHERGATGPDVGFSTIEDSYLVATEGIAIWAPASVNGASDLSPQTTVIRNVRFDYPTVDLTTQQPPLAHIMMRDTSQVLDPAKMNQSLRNDVQVHNYNRAPGADGDDLYIVPDYQGPGRCDASIGQCDSDISSSFVDINKGHVYPLR